jgi:hypothetical protein
MDAIAAGAPLFELRQTGKAAAPASPTHCVGKAMQRLLKARMAAVNRSGELDHPIV